jgi:hypothetical protein
VFGLSDDNTINVEFGLSGDNTINIEFGLAASIFCLLGMLLTWQLARRGRREPTRETTCYLPTRNGCHGTDDAEPQRLTQQPGDSYALAAAASLTYLRRGRRVAGTLTVLLRAESI